MSIAFLPTTPGTGVVHTLAPLSRRPSCERRRGTGCTLGTLPHLLYMA